MTAREEALVAVLNAARELRAQTAERTQSGTMTVLPTRALDALWAAIDAVDGVVEPVEGPRRRFCAAPECFRVVDIPGGYCYAHSPWGPQARNR